MKSTKIRISMLIVGILACWLFPSAVGASVQVDGIYYELNTSAKTAAVASNPDKYSGGVYIPESFIYNGETYKVTSIGSTAFLDCSGMTAINMPSSVTSIAASAFERCTGLSIIYIGKGVTTINYEAFKNCSNLTSIILPASVKTISDEVFSGCTSLTEIIVERTTVPTISSSTFNGVDKTSCMVYVPEGYQSAYSSASYWKTFSNIEERTVLATGSCGDEGDNVRYTIYSDMTMVISGTGAMKEEFIDWNGNTGSPAPINADYYKYIKRVVIEDGVTSIGRYAFSGYQRLLSVLIGNSVTVIEGSAFQSCPSLNSVIMGNSVSLIASCAFLWCYGLTSVSFPNSLVSVMDQAFSDCTGLTSVTIPYSVTSIGSIAFVGCTSLSSIIVDAGNEKYDSRNDCNAIIETSTNTLIAGCKNSIIPNSVTSIANQAFSGCTGLTSVTIPYSVTSIGVWAFSHCTGLNRLSISYNLNSIGYGAFEDCPNLSSISVSSSNKTYDSRDNCNAIINTTTNELIFGCKYTVIPKSVTSIGSDAFSGCVGLTSVTFPNNLTKIGSSAFYGCTGLTSVTIPNSVTTIGGYAFHYCTNLASVTFGNNLTTIGNNAFSSCYNLTSLILPDGVITISDNAFNRCTSLTSVTIPRSVTSIGDYAFAECSNLSSIRAENPSPIDISYKVFNNVPKNSCTLYVPTGSKAAYENASCWNDFLNIVEYGSGSGTDISSLDNAIYVDQVNGLVGGTMDIPVKMKNDFDVRGFQFTMELPEGATVNSWQVNPDRLPSGISASKVLPMERIEGNRIVATCVLNDGNKTFTGNEGVIATVNVTFGSDMEAGVYPIYLTEASISDASSTNQKVLSDVKATLVLDDYVVGDTNGDGKVLVGDVISILNYIVGERPEGFNEKAADVNSDGKILVGDVIAVLNIIVGL